MNEESYVKDSVQVYKWLRKRTSKKVYFWGLSLGTLVSMETISKLKVEGIMPSGIILEAPTTSPIEVLEIFSPAKVLETIYWLYNV